MQVWASQGTGSCAARALIDIQVTALVAAPTVSSPKQFCSADTNTLADVTPQVTGVNIIYWDAATLGNQLASTTVLSDGMQVWASQGAGSCAVRVLIDIQVDAVVDAPTGDNEQFFCSADTNTVGDLIATGVNIVWYADATSTTVLDSSEVLVDGENYFAAQGVGTCAQRFEVTVTVYPDPLPTPTGSVGQTFCADDNPTVTDLEANEPGVIWYADEVGGTVLDPTTALEDGGVYYGALVVGSCESDGRFLVKVQITAFIPAPVGDADQVFCSIDSPTTADIIVYGLGIQWYDAATGGVNITGDTLTDGMTYYATQTVGTCGESTNTLAVTVHLTTIIPAPIGAADQNFCIDDNPTVSDIVASGTGIQYYTTMTGGTALTGSTALVDGTTYYLSQTEAPCGESGDRLMVTAHLSSVIAAPTTSSVDQLFCSLDIPTVQDIDVTGFDIQWYNALGNPLVSNYVLQDGVTYYAAQGSGSCAEQLAITVHLVTVVPAPTGSSEQVFCNPTSTPLLSDVVVVGTAIQWYDAATGGTALAMGTTLVDGMTYYASQTLGSCGESGDRLAVLVHITTNLPLPIVDYPDQYFCLVDNATVGDLLADTTTSTNTLVWYDSLGNVITDMTTVLVDGAIYDVKQVNAYGCDGNTTSITVHLVNEPPAPVISPTEYSYCETDGKIISDLGITALSGLALNWYNPSGTAVPDTTVLVAGDYTVTQTTFSGNCESTGVIVTINLTAVPPLPVAETVQYFCPENTPVGSDLSAEALAGYDLTWTHVDGSTVLAGELLVSGAIYYVSQVATGGGCPSFNLAIQVVISNPSEATGLATQIFCSRDSATIGDMEVFSTNDTDAITWYDMPTGGTLLSENDLLVQGVTYYAEVVSEQGCVSLSRFAVTVELDIDACDYVANSFTPNGDGVNDTFYIPAVANYPNFELHIYNRYGNVVYDYKNEGRTSPIWWDGRSRNSLNVLDDILPAATYFYTIYFNDGTDRKPESGWVYLKR
jgi:gliding motility-associated-like protein